MLLTRRVAQLIVLSLTVVLFAQSRSPAGDAEKQKPKAGRKVRAIQLGGIKAAPAIQIIRGGFPGGFAARLNPTYLLRRLDVQKELKITDEQKTKIDEINAEQTKTLRGLYGGLRDLTQEERQKKAAEAREKRAKLSKEMQKKINAVLTDAQRKRLQEIGVQMQGHRALSSESVAKELGLSSDQKDKIKAAYASQQEKTQAVRQDVQDGKIERTKTRDKYAEIQKEIEAAVLGVLTDAQKKKFEGMKGKKFEFQRRQFRLQPGGRGGGRKPKPGDEV